MDNQRLRILEMFPQYRDLVPTVRSLLHDEQLPWWFGWKAFHQAHRSNLVRKDEFHYIFPDVHPRMPYIWPSDEEGVWKAQHSRDSQYFVKL